MPAREDEGCKGEGEEIGIHRVDRRPAGFGRERG
jgi:hypothetical protein